MARTVKSDDNIADTPPPSTRSGLGGGPLTTTVLANTPGGMGNIPDTSPSSRCVCQILNNVPRNNAVTHHRHLKTVSCWTSRITLFTREKLHDPGPITNDVLFAYTPSESVGHDSGPRLGRRSPTRVDNTTCQHVSTAPARTRTSYRDTTHYRHRSGPSRANRRSRSSVWACGCASPRPVRRGRNLVLWETGDQDGESLASGRSNTLGLATTECLDRRFTRHTMSLVYDAPTSPCGRTE